MNLFEQQQQEFTGRHIGPNEQETKAMLKTIGVSSVDELIEKTVPSSIRLQQPLQTAGPVSEFEYLTELKQTASLNKVCKSYIGQGYYNTIVPSVILRTVFESPGWYTQYTPYQAEIAQGRLESLLNFQTMVSDLTGLPIANASLLDEGTAAAEAMTLAKRSVKAKGNVFVVSGDTHPQTIEVIQTRAAPLGLVVKIIQSKEEWWAAIAGDDYFAALQQYPAVIQCLYPKRAVTR